MKTAKENYDIASKFDSEGKEEEAIEFYEEAFKEIDDLTTEDQKGLLLGMASTYRWIGKLNRSLEIFNFAIKRFPGSKEYRIFKTFTDFDYGRKEFAFGSLLEVLIEETNSKEILQYKRALSHYSKFLINEG